jgi:hypothetical protein
MSKYRVVQPALWGSAFFRSLPKPAPSAQLLFLYLMTGPESCGIPGVANIGEAALAEALRWSVPVLRKQLRVLIAADALVFDKDARLAFVPNELESTRPANPNVASHWAHVLSELPECDLRDRILRTALGCVADLGERFTQPFRQLFDEPSRNNKHKHNLEHKNKNEHDRNAAAGSLVQERGPKVYGPPSPIPPALAEKVTALYGPRPVEKVGG